MTCRHIFCHNPRNEVELLFGAKWIIKTFQIIPTTYHQDIIENQADLDAFEGLVDFAQDIVEGLFESDHPLAVEMVERILFEAKCANALKLVLKSGFPNQLLFQAYPVHFMQFVSILCFVELSGNADKSMENVTRLQCSAIAESLCLWMQKQYFAPCTPKLAVPHLFYKLMLVKIVQMKNQFDDLLDSAYFEELVAHLCCYRNDWEWSAMLEREQWISKHPTIQNVSAKWRAKQPTADQLCLSTLLRQLSQNGTMW